MAAGAVEACTDADATVAAALKGGAEVEVAVGPGELVWPNAKGMEFEDAEKLKGDKGTVGVKVENLIAGTVETPVGYVEKGVKTGDGEGWKVVVATAVETVGAGDDGTNEVVDDLGAGDGVDDGLVIALMLTVDSDGSTLTFTSFPASPALGRDDGSGFEAGTDDGDACGEC